MCHQRFTNFNAPDQSSRSVFAVVGPRVAPSASRAVVAARGWRRSAGLRTARQQHLARWSLDRRHGMTDVARYVLQVTRNSSLSARDWSMVARSWSMVRRVCTPARRHCSRRSRRQPAARTAGRLPVHRHADRSSALICTYAASIRSARATESTVCPGFSFTCRIRLPVPSSHRASIPARRPRTPASSQTTGARGRSAHPVARSARRRWWRRVFSHWGTARLCPRLNIPSFAFVAVNAFQYARRHCMSRATRDRARPSDSDRHSLPREPAGLLRRAARRRPYATAYHPGGAERYSYLSASAGFARATSSACPETVRRAMSAASTLAAMKDVKATST